MKIKVDKNSRVVILNDKWRVGGVLVKVKCSTCNCRLIYFDKYDSDFCPDCNEWVTEKCDDEDCFYCSKRPATPLHEFYNDV